MLTHALLTETGAVDSYIEFGGEPLPDGWSVIELPNDFDPKLDGFANGKVVKGAKRERYQAEKRKSHAKDRDRKIEPFLTKAEFAQMIYAEKSGEVRDYAKLSAADKRLFKDRFETLYPFLFWDAAAHEDSVEEAFNRFLVGRRESLAEIAKMEADYQQRKNDSASGN